MISVHDKQCEKDNRFTVPFNNFITIFFTSNKTEAKAVIPGPSDIYVKQGSEVVLTCVVSQGPHELGQMFWLRGKYNHFSLNHISLCPFPFCHYHH